LDGSRSFDEDNAYPFFVFFVPGLLVQLGVFGASFAGFSLRPHWLRRASDFMPIRWIVDAVRTSFGGAFDGTKMSWGTGWAVVLFAPALWWGTATLRKENAWRGALRPGSANR
jgi:hypothetical protein